jgi:hypothetical protein
MGESFFQRWARRKAEVKNEDARLEKEHAEEASSSQSAERMPEQGAMPLPTLQDVAHLTNDSDYSLFLSKGIDKTVRRAALKKLFSDPHFNIMDGLDIYIDDYNKASPVPPAMLAALKHTHSLLEAVAKEEARHAEPQPDPSLQGIADEMERSTVAGLDDAERMPPGHDVEDEPPEDAVRLENQQGDNGDGMQAAQGRS